MPLPLYWSNICFKQASTSLGRDSRFRLDPYIWEIIFLTSQGYNTVFDGNTVQYSSLELESHCHVLYLAVIASARIEWLHSDPPLIH